MCLLCPAVPAVSVMSAVPTMQAVLLTYLLSVLVWRLRLLFMQHTRLFTHPAQAGCQLRMASLHALVSTNTCSAPELFADA